MKAPNLTQEELKREVKRLERNIRARAKRIESRGNQASQYLPREYRKLIQENPKKISQMTPKELRSFYRGLNRLNSAKSATVEGATQSRETFGYTEDVLSRLSEEQKKKMFDIYDRIAEEFLEYGSEFKYELFEVAADITEKYTGRDKNFYYDYDDDDSTEAVEEALYQELEDLYERQQLNDYDKEELRDDFISLIERFRKFNI